MSKELADLVFPNIDKTPEYYEELYPKRNLPEGTMVTRFAPSPTGFIHVGSLFGANLDRRLATQTNGICYLRIEDTDGKREVDDGINLVINGLKVFEIEFDEGPIGTEGSKGNYGPYIQSQRKDIYQCYAKSLIERGLAYPCFCTAEELDVIRERQEKLKIVPGYYGDFAACRKMSESQMIERIKKGDPYIIRLKSQGSMSRKIRFKDMIRGIIEFPENVQDIVIIKSDGLPTYHFAHAVDDHLMRTTHVIRGEEWISSVPLHVELFKALEFDMPEYIHTPTIMKEEDGSKRKIRADFEGRLQDKLNSEYNERVRFCDMKNSQLQNTAESMRLSILGRDSKAKDDKPLGVVDAYVKENTTELVDPLDVKKKIELLEEKRNILLTELDTQIKVSNATTFIEIA